MKRCGDKIYLTVYIHGNLPGTGYATSLQYPRISRKQILTMWFHPLFTTLTSSKIFLHLSTSCPISACYFSDLYVFFSLYNISRGIPGEQGCYKELWKLSTMGCHVEKGWWWWSGRNRITKTPDVAMSVRLKIRDCVNEKVRSLEELKLCSENRQ